MATPRLPVSRAPAFTARTMGQTAMSMGQPARQQQSQQLQPASAPDPEVKDSDQDVPQRPLLGADTAPAARAAMRARAPIDFEGGLPHNGYSGAYSGFNDGRFVSDMDRVREGVRRIRQWRTQGFGQGVSPAPRTARAARVESKYGGSFTETHTEEEEKSTETGSAPSAGAQWCRHVNMHDSSFCRLVRSYESAAITGSGTVGGLGVDTGSWTKLFMGGFNTNLSATTGFFPAGVTLGDNSNVCLGFHFDTSVVTGVDGTVGPRIVRGGPTSTAYVTQTMLQPEGWTEWNNDFYMFSNIFRYSRLEKLEMLIKVTPHTQSGYVGVDSAPYTNNSIAYQDPGVLYVAPWSGEPGIVANYATGNGVMTSPDSNGADVVNYWETKPGVRKVDLGDAYSKRSQYQIHSFPVCPIQPVEQPQSDNNGNPIVGSDTVVSYRKAPQVDGFSFVAGAANHNAFGWTLYWYHPDFNGMVVGNGGTNTVIPPWIEVKFRATMKWWGLYPPDLTAGAAPLLRISQLPGVEEIRQKCVQEYYAKQEQQKKDLQASLQGLKQAISRPANVLPSPVEEYVQVPNLKSI